VKCAKKKKVRVPHGHEFIFLRAPTFSDDVPKKKPLSVALHFSKQRRLAMDTQPDNVPTMASSPVRTQAQAAYSQKYLNKLQEVSLAPPFLFLLTLYFPRI
jgi:hypothetical protein